MVITRTTTRTSPSHCSVGRERSVFRQNDAQPCESVASTVQAIAGYCPLVTVASYGSTVSLDPAGHRVSLLLVLGRMERAVGSD